MTAQNRTGTRGAPPRADAAAKTICIRLSPAEIVALDAITPPGRNRSDVIRQAVAAWVKAHAKN